MCYKCKKKNCNCEINPADQQAAIDNLLEITEELQMLAKFLNGHPIIAIDDPADIVQFDLGTGVGSGDWERWAICDGQTHDGIATPDLRDRFLVGALGNYTVGDTGGLDSVQLTVPELPIHTHVVTDPGHTHVITDPGHTHGITDAGHIHTADQPSHNHGLTNGIANVSIAAVPDHIHEIWEMNNVGTADGVVDFKQVDASPVHGDTDYTQAAGGHTPVATISGATDSTDPAITVDPAVTGIVIDVASTGNTNVSNVTGVTNQNTGSDQPHENRPPYHSVIFVKKVA